ncbi:MAG: stage II sporulation protein R [Candidatus Improbicoccus pseudotrichonymphae]|uniref:Stage II sporulation protein R n=1 Tax=Candidatus Improbicoccus pseudotrichonymphae TaxID=3033792 RepID=A0AA48KV91_9FIRM|nr:MAG: stage II sporulation protein R [Candidatus Improbicoccus pseudotrichonymphae]
MLNNVERSIIFGFVFIILFSIVSFSRKCENISNKFSNLQIIAHPNFGNDQKIKLKINDEIVNFFDNNENFASENPVETKKSVLKNMNSIKNAVNREEKINFEVCETHFGNRIYDEFCLPAKDCDSRLATSEKDNGRNLRYIVLLPGCIPACEKKSKKNLPPIEDILNGEEEIIVIKKKEKYEIRFKTLEMIEDARCKVRSVLNGFKCWVKAKKEQSENDRKTENKKSILKKIFRKN